MEQLQNETRPTVVLASGDPLFYGIGGYLASKINIEVYPYFSSIQLAFAKMGESWQDAYFVSVHGRSMKGLAQRIDGKESRVTYRCRKFPESNCKIFTIIRND